jgi:hypothetical protein
VTSHETLKVHESKTQESAVDNKIGTIIVKRFSPPLLLHKCIFQHKNKMQKENEENTKSSKAKAWA